MGEICVQDEENLQQEVSGLEQHRYQQLQVRTGADCRIDPIKENQIESLDPFHQWEAYHP